MTILGLLAAAIGSLTNAESALVRNFGLNAKAEAMADAGIHRALASLLETDRADTELTFTVPNGIVRVSITDEDGKIDLNAIRPASLVRLLSGLEVPPASAHRITDAIIDYRDPDEERRADGAERPDYEAAGRSYGPKNAPFESKEELLLVLGMDRELFQRLQAALTVVTRSAAFDPRVASPEALHALPLPLQIWSNRLVGFELSEPMNERLPVDPSVTATRQRFYTLRSLACLRPQGAQFAREAIVKLDRRSATEPVQIMVWKQPLDLDVSSSACKS